MLQITSVCLAQDSVFIRFDFLANGERLILNEKSYVNAAGEKYSVSKLRFYTGNFGFAGWLADRPASQQVDSTYRLIDAADHAGFKIAKPRSIRVVDDISFTIGVDSITQISGAMDGDLDPLKGMYWTWNSGYINFKFEGVSEVSKAAGNRFEHHIGGYREGEQTSSVVTLPIQRIQTQHLESITITVNLDEYGKGSKEYLFAKQPLIGTPGNAAVALSASLKKMFIASPCCFLL